MTIRLTVCLVALATTALAHEGHGNKNAPASAKALRNPLSGTQATSEAGRAAYDRLCAACHDADGRALSATAKKMKPRPTNLADQRMDTMKDGEIYWVLTNGIAKTMPAFKAQLDDTARWQVVLYVRQLCKSPAVGKDHH